MRVVYKPEGIDSQSWEVHIQRLPSPEAMAIERQTGWTYKEWSGKLANGSMTALQALLWVLLKRTRHGLRWDELVFTMDEVDILADEDEEAGALTALQAKPDRTPEEQAVLDGLLAKGVSPKG